MRSAVLSSVAATALVWVSASAQTPAPAQLPMSQQTTSQQATPPQPSAQTPTAQTPTAQTPTAQTPSRPLFRPAEWFGRSKPAAPPSEEAKRLAEVNVELAWLADPITFPCELLAQWKDNKLEVQGRVPDRTVREHALKVARARFTGTVVDQMREAPEVAAPREKLRPGEVQRAALETLEQLLPELTGRLSVLCGPDGKVAISGNVASLEEKRAVSLAMRSVPGCTSVSNQTQSGGRGETPQGLRARLAARRERLAGKQPTTSPTLPPAKANAPTPPRPSGTPPIITDRVDTPGTGMPPKGMPPTGMPPTGMPPLGMPPLGMPPVGAPPVVTTPPVVTPSSPPVNDGPSLPPLPPAPPAKKESKQPVSAPVSAPLSAPVSSPSVPQVSPLAPTKAPPTKEAKQPASSVPYVSPFPPGVEVTEPVPTPAPTPAPRTPPLTPAPALTPAGPTPIPALTPAGPTPIPALTPVPAPGNPLPIPRVPGPLQSVPPPPGGKSPGSPPGGKFPADDPIQRLRIAGRPATSDELPPVTAASVAAASPAAASPAAALSFAPAEPASPGTMPGEPYVSHGVVVISESDLGRNTPPIPAPGFTNLLKQRIQKTCGESARVAQVDFLSASKLLVELHFASGVDSESVARRIVTMPELRAYDPIIQAYTR